MPADARATLIARLLAKSTSIGPDRFAGQQVMGGMPLPPAAGALGVVAGGKPSADLAISTIEDLAKWGIAGQARKVGAAGYEYLTGSPFPSDPSEALTRLLMHIQPAPNAPRRR